MATLDSKASAGEVSVEERLQALFDLQKVVSEIDKIRTLRGELPLEVQDLEDEIEGLETRLTNLESEIKKLNDNILAKKNEIKDAGLLIKKYEAQQSNVRNNREYDSLTKEIEFQTLEIELCEKRIREFTAEMKTKSEIGEASRKQLDERKGDLAAKKAELNEIVSETQVEEERLKSKSKEIETRIDDRLLTAFKRIRKNARNGLAVVTVARDACGGCFNKIPPQRQLDIQLRKKIIVCEYCGRILVDGQM
ncbi:zinc ribbon domain-containing protein [Alkaliflexus imshenetskii]|uniref:zinc ribbon domain-containing protein n=1 Tax=Alkaliflexus imshenetskii TaxID=286730 RepID=UPI00047C65E5|nr:C4-type zinc ribbon domain-containing protein [Alkaliflexus imshenetskii]